MPEAGTPAGETRDIPLRPRRIEMEHKRELAGRLAEELCKAGHIRDAAEAVEDIARAARMGMDGYEIAKALESEHGWDCNFEMSEILDGFSSMAQSVVTQLEREWVEAYRVEPPLPIGERIVLDNGYDVEYGTIDGIYEYGPARYTVVIEGDPKAYGPGRSRRIVKYEDAVPAVQPDASPAAETPQP